ncbi:MAG: RNA-guided pseudouridylation complex pseudouridine synthase subunit Cbf5 [Thermoplasmatota archaeon]
MKGPEEDDKLELLGSIDTNPSYGHYPDARPLELLLDTGMIVLDKPNGPTSHQVVSWIKNILEIEKAGHHGTLDPNTTGVLPVALGKAVRMLDLTLEEGKEYAALMHLHRKVPKENLQAVLSDFTGRIYQMVPVRSAVKRRLRERTIEYMKVLDRKENDVLLLIGCESGTYIRTLIHDMGEVLGVGANMIELRRTRSGSLEHNECVTLQQVKDAWVHYQETGSEDLLRKVIIPSENLLRRIPKIYVKDSTVDAVCHGAPLGKPGISAVDRTICKGCTVAVLSLKGEAVAVGKAMMDFKEMISGGRGMSVKVDRVIMEPGTYPRAWKKRS